MLPIARVLLVRSCLGRSGLNELLESLCSLAEQLEGFGMLRTADDLRSVADELRDDSGVRRGSGIERLTIISARLARGGYRRSSNDVACLVDDLRRLHEAAPVS